MKRYLDVVWAVLWKDLRIELRSKDVFTSMAVFAVLAVMIFNFAFELRVPDKTVVIPGVLWVTITFSGVLGLGRSFISEKDRGSIAGLLLAPVDRSAIYFGKMLANLLFILIVEAFLLPLMVIFFNTNFVSPALLLLLFLGTLGFAAVGTIFSGLAVNTRTREILLPVLLFPVMLPVLMAGIRATIGLMEGDSIADLAKWFNLVFFFDILYIVVAYLTFDYVVEE
ncbi:MAG TPA: cytochrome C biogenesis protein [Anaerolineae bacterium]|nr:cytochrome C biogenesis protein [Anaerolineae bacterium]